MNMEYLEHKTLKINNSLDWSIAKADFDFDGDLYHRAVEQAALKSKYTMNASQAGQFRSSELKFQKQLMGMLGEIYAQKYLENVLEFQGLTEKWEVIRYDDVRTDGFKSPENEYDIMLVNNDDKKIFTVESRSSMTKAGGIISGIRYFDIIGLYTSPAKSKEGYNDIYIRPLYDFTNYKAQQYDELKFEQSLKNGFIELYIVAGCLEEDMITKGYNKNMGQEGSIYTCVKILEGYDSNAFQTELASLLNS